MTVAVNRLANGTIELTVTLVWAEVATSYKKVVDELVKTTEIPGFRPGKAPSKLLEEKLDKTKVYEEVLKQIVPRTYADAIKQENITPIIPPRIEIISFKENEVCQFRAQTCERPAVKLGDYQKAIVQLRADKSTKIWVPGKDKNGHQSSHRADHSELNLSDVFKALTTCCQVPIPVLLVENEVNRMLAGLIDQTQKLGLTVEQYLVSQGKTTEGLRSEYAAQANQNLALEFILEAIADQEKVEVSDEEAEKVIKEAKTSDEREAMNAQRYYLATLLRRQKTLDKLIKPIV